MKYSKKYCPHCGQRLSVDSEFCGKCGKKILSNEEFENMQNKDLESCLNETQTSKKGKISRVISIIITTVLVVCAVSYVLNYMENSNQQKKYMELLKKSYIYPEEFGKEKTVTEALATIGVDEEYEIVDNPDGSLGVVYRAVIGWDEKNVPITLKMVFFPEENLVIPFVLAMEGEIMDQRFMEAFLYKCEGYDTLAAELIQQWENGETGSFIAEMKELENAAVEESKVLENSEKETVWFEQTEEAERESLETFENDIELPFIGVNGEEFSVDCSMLGKYIWGEGRDYGAEIVLSYGETNQKLYISGYCWADINVGSIEDGIVACICSDEEQPLLYEDENGNQLYIYPLETGGIEVEQYGEFGGMGTTFAGIYEKEK